MRVENIFLNSAYEAKIIYLGERLIIKIEPESVGEWSAPEFL